MSKKHQKLELTWIGKGEEPKLEPRILIENPEYSYGDRNTGNMLIHGDNLLALKALEQDYTEKVKCICIDPPYNTGSAFEHYDDGIEHSLWLSLMKPRLDILRTLLSDDGSIWICIDDNECHYLKILCDEIFGRANFCANAIWQKKYSPQNDAKNISTIHDHILVYAKDKTKWKPNLLPRDEKGLSRYKNPDNDPRGPWKNGDLTSKTKAAGHSYPITSPLTGRVFYPSKGRQWAASLTTHERLMKENRVWFGMDGNNIPSLKQFLSEVQDGTVAMSIWNREDVGDNQEAKKEALVFNSADIFDTPKPERLIERILYLSTKEGDLVLDSFLGSGTTAAVAHKMRRNWIAVELGGHAITHCVPRLKKVVAGEQGGISKAMNWQGGGGFKFYTLAPSLLNQDKYGNWVISKEYKPDMLSAAMAKQEGFHYEPDGHTYWKQGRSSEKDFIYTTTQFMTVELLDKIMDEMQPEESLLIACKAYQQECVNRYPNISIKKIPQMLLGKCEFGKDDYSLNIVNLPKEDNDEGDIVAPTAIENEDKMPKTPKKKKADTNPELFD